jgi:hypothetical protein
MLESLSNIFIMMYGCWGNFSDDEDIPYTVYSPTGDN